MHSDYLYVSARAYWALVDEALGAIPAECCGLLGGRAGRVERIYPVANVAEHREARYEMDPAEMWATRRRVVGEGLEVLGFYHSHPRTSAFPSSYDVERAYYPKAYYLIVGVTPELDLRAFRIANGEVSEMGLDVEADHPTL